MRKHVSAGRDALAPDVPTDPHIAIVFAGRYPVAQVTSGSRHSSVMPRVIPVVHVDEHPPFRRHQPRELAQRLDPCSGGQYMSQNVPQTSDHVKAALLGLKTLGAHGPYGRLHI